MQDLGSVEVTVMIATHNRVEELRKTLESLSEQRGQRVEVIVADDASTDGTSEMVQREFPEVRLLRSDRNLGSVESRNRIISEARGEIIVGLDDDSRFIKQDSLARVVARMAAEPDLGVLSFQPIGPEHPERMTEEGRLRGEWHCASYAACGVAIRRSVIDRVGSFPSFFFHMYEEPDFCLRVWDAGYRVLQWNELVVYHEWSGVNRNEKRVHRRHACNEACSVIMRYPWYLVAPVVVLKAASQARYAMSRGAGWVIREPGIWVDVAMRLPVSLRNRNPVGLEAVKIVAAVNRTRTADAQEVRGFGEMSWRELMAMRFLRSRAG